MHPAPSIIAFTVLSGLGLGLIATLGLGYGPGEGTFAWVACVFAFLVTAGGGAASAGHLARPDRAWRAFSQWRSSWLSREACLMVAALVFFGLYAGLWLLSGLRLALLGWIATAFSLTTIHATAMIYAQLKTVPRWSATPTPALFPVFGISGGVLAYSTCLAVTGHDVPIFATLVALVLAAGVGVWWQTQAAGARRGLDGSSLETATGLSGLGRVRLLEPPHTGDNYLLREMAFEVGRRRAFELRRVGAVLGFLVPLVLVLLAPLIGSWLMLPALLLHLTGMMALRWLFFAEAEHVQALYYGRR